MLELLVKKFLTKSKKYIEFDNQIHQINNSIQVLTMLE